MANKLFLVCATLALCFLLTNASIYRTVVEFDDDEASNPIGPRQKCQKEFQASQHLRACQQLMRQQMRQGRGDDDEDDIENPQRSEVLEQCCNELRQEDTVCVCPTLKRAARSVSIQGQQMRPLQVRKAYQTAKHLPNVCNIPQVDVCPFKIPFVPSYY
ncbi:hypothetical protein CARUB_v10028644mg [Capsella rubella]|uniref:Bifunctional inhibitor/plant lipid transfer protein/seed storage helical domain-containing protein n=1 Tax=Capsella rubella TaxID=81985 RepID=R0GSC4_9BRAS|nr:2S seed storage protein 4 [Capsella rubella]EOA15245.1 hypothetical protein CARUB_v10028644mg [Capsella rubella]